MSTFYRAIKKMIGAGDRGAIGIVLAISGPGRYHVSANGQNAIVENVGEPVAVGQRVGVLVKSETGIPFAILGPVSAQ